MALSDMTIAKTVDAVTLTANTPVPVWTPAAGKRFVIQSFVVSSTVATNLRLLDASGLLMIVPLQAGVPLYVDISTENGVQSALVGNALQAQSAVTTTINGTFLGDEI